MSPELEQAVRERIDLGHSKDQITSELHAAGYDDATVEQVYATISSGGASNAVPPAALPGVGQMFGAGWKFMLSRLDLLGLYALLTFLVSSTERLSPYLPSSGSGIVVVAVVFVVAYVSLMVLLQMVFIHSAVSDYRSRPVSIGDSFGWAVSHVWGWLWFVTLAMLVGFGGFLLFVIPGIIATVYISMSYYAFVDEDVRGMAALQRSRELVYGHFWAVFGRMFLFGLLSVLCMIPMLILVGMLAFVLPETVGLLMADVMSSLFGAGIGLVMVYGLVTLYGALKERQVAPVSKTSWYNVYVVLGILCVLGIAATIPSFVSEMRSGFVGMEGFELPAEMTENMTAEEQAEFEAFLDEYGADLDVN